jgi:hypothetical protein
VRPRVLSEGELHGQEIVDCFMAAVRRGDWKAGEALMLRVFGRPTERVSVEMPTSPEQVEALSLSQIRELRARMHVVEDKG